MNSFKLNNYLLQDCEYIEESEPRFLIKKGNENVIRWEWDVYNYLIENTKLIHYRLLDKINNKMLIYRIDYKKISLNDFLNKHRKSKYNVIILNELFSFINTFYASNFIHGNLHLYNIYVDEFSFFRNFRFYVIDFTNSYLLSEEANNSGHYFKKCFCLKITSNNFKELAKYIDFISIYTSLKNKFRGNSNKITELKELFLYYTNPDIFNKFS